MKAYSIDAMKSTRPEVTLIRATREHIDLLVPMFIQYREFYGFASDVDTANHFLLERISRDESVVFMVLAETNAGHDALGFTQLYSSFSSLRMQRIWILYDLFVRSVARNRGIATMLMNAARGLAEETKAKAIILETGVNNYPAQSLYEALGYKRDKSFFRYSLNL